MLLTLAFAAATGVAACGSHPFVREGDADGVQVAYALNHAADAVPVAQHYCAQYDRTARLVQTDPDTAYFKCEGR